MKTPWELYQQTRSTNKRLTPEEEAILKTHAHYSYHYARDVIKGIWKEGETAILTSPAYSCWYAQDIIKSRWLQAEETIKKAPKFWKAYKEHFKQDFEVEKILKS